MDPNVVPDVLPSDPSPETLPSDPGSVTPAPEGRPVENLAAEMQRKFTKTEQALQAIMQYLATNRGAPTPPTAGTPPPSDGPSDDELWSRAQQGDRAAFELYQTRIADRRLSTQLRSQTHEKLVDDQLAALMQSYPLHDPTHPLTQTANLAYNLLVQQGFPTGKATMLDAALRAIAGRPDLVADLHNKGALAPEGVRRSATRTAQAGMIGAQPRTDVPASVNATRPISPAELALARRMGVKDPAKARERFVQRQAEGRSGVGGVGTYIKEDL